VHRQKLHASTLSVSSFPSLALPFSFWLLVSFSFLPFFFTNVFAEFCTDLAIRTGVQSSRFSSSREQKHARAWQTCISSQQPYLFSFFL